MHIYLLVYLSVKSERNIINKIRFLIISTLYIDLVNYARKAVKVWARSWG
jgi:hypothetical protein